MRYILALDQGTTSSRAVIYDETGAAVCQAQQEFMQYYPKPGWVEHDPFDILRSQISSMQHAVRQAGVSLSDIAGIGITNQRETALLWDRETGQPLCNAIVWQCRRTTDLCRQLEQAGHADMLRKKTGLQLDAYFSATKLKWMLDNIGGAREQAAQGRLCFGTVDTWLIYNLTGRKQHVTDYTNASRTMLFNIHDHCWDSEILALLDIPESVLPGVRECSGYFGELDEGIFEVKVPILGVAGDQQAALFGQACFHEGGIKNTYGTGCFLLMNTGEKPIQSNAGLLTTIAMAKGGRVQYALEGSVFNAGSTIQWLRDGLQIIGSAPESEALALSAGDTGGVYFVPAFTGLGAPWWDMDARGTVIGITRGTGREHIARAALEAIAYQTRDVVDAMSADSGLAISSLNVDGGASANNFLMQFQADILGADVVRPKNIETTALGAAYLAGLAAGVWKSENEITQLRETDRVFRASMDAAEKERKYEKWKQAVARSGNWA